MPDEIDNLITDRTSDDLWYANHLMTKALIGGYNALTLEEKFDYRSGPKGAYCYIDLNRVGTAVAYLAQLMRARGYAPDVSPKTDWKHYDVPTAAQLSQYLADIAAIKDATGSTVSIPRSMAGLSYYGANNIEKLLKDAYARLLRIQQAYTYSGMLNAGMTYIQQGGIT